MEIRSLCVSMYIFGVVSFNSIPRLLNIISIFVPQLRGWIPDPSSINNWVLRVGLGLLRQVKPIPEPWVAIVDHCVGQGTQKVLVVLRVPVDTLLRQEGAIKRENCEVIGVKIVDATHGEAVAEDFSEIFAKSGIPEYIIKDRDGGLRRGGLIWSEPLEKKVHMVDDIGHVVASCLKAEFEKKPEFKLFISLTSKGNNFLRQSKLTRWMSPTPRTKGRFQSLLELARWAKNLIAELQVRGVAKKGSELEKLREVFPGFVKLNPFITRFAHTIEIGSAIMKILKNKGLTQESGEECKKLLEVLPNNSKVKTGILNWLKTHLEIKQKIDKYRLMTDNYPLITSSDIIESIFGTYKYLGERSPQRDMNRFVYIFPALCAQLSTAKIAELLELVSHQDLMDEISKKVPETTYQKKRAHSKKIKEKKSGVNAPLKV